MKCIFNITRLFKAFGYSISALRPLLKEEAFRQELFLILLFSPLVYYVKSSILDFIIYIMIGLLILAIEAINTGFELISDKIDSSINDFTKTVKDIGSFSVLCIILIDLIWVLYLCFEWYFNK